ncbi:MULTISPECIES: tetratricopeptide repeat protein [unclassified Bradyrhizobium]|uniref:tetratricopeptide repeat protein n=1 Tax=unclassified Bradyrhizobium TaxID=2631580 RepID=UPI0028ED90C5|nr:MULTISPECIES: tetratricopeptide repeat protein [unclassified Bradyrhizobium]
MRARLHNLAYWIMLATSITAAPAHAAEDPLMTSIRQIQTRWETIKFTVPEGDEQTRQMDALGSEVDALAAKYPDRVEAQIWDGIVTSERASMYSAFSALSLANRARDTLEKAYKMSPTALDGGAPTSLGVLYYRVPGFPVGFGDNSKARTLLEQATASAPNGLDAWYFYGDFLVSRGEYARARDAFMHALSIPAHPDRPLWDKNRRIVIKEKLDDIRAKQ